MKVLVLLTATALGAFALGRFQQPDLSKIPNIPKDMKPYFFATVQAGPKWVSLDTDEGKKGIADHLAWMRKMIEAKKILLAGPFLDTGEGKDFGIYIVAAPDEATARKIVEDEPEIRTERFVYKLRPIMLPSLDSLKITYAKQPGSPGPGSGIGGSTPTLPSPCTQGEALALQLERPCIH